MPEDLDHALRNVTDPGRLIDLHIQAAAVLPTRPEQRFHLTHAWVYALVTGDTSQITRLEKDLRSLGGL